MLYNCFLCYLIKIINYNKLHILLSICTLRYFLEFMIKMF